MGMIAASEKQEMTMDLDMASQTAEAKSIGGVFPSRPSEAGAKAARAGCVTAESDGLGS